MCFVSARLNFFLFDLFWVCFYSLCSKQTGLKAVFTSCSAQYISWLSHALCFLLFYKYCPVAFPAMYFLLCHRFNIFEIVCYDIFQNSTVQTNLQNFLLSCVLSFLMCHVFSLFLGLFLPLRRGHNKKQTPFTVSLWSYLWHNILTLTL